MVSGTRGKVIWWLKVGGQERRVQITLDRTYSTRTDVKPLSKRFLDMHLATVTVLRQLSSARGQLVQGAASLCNCASQVLYKHPWSTHTHALAKLLLPAFIRNFFDTNVVTSTDHLVDQASMQALALGGELAFVVGKSPARGKIALTVLPGEPSLAVLFDAPLLIVVLRVVGTALAVQLAL